MEIPGYEVRHRIGEGGMATAYLAVQTSLGRKVVLKVLDSTRQETKEGVERFLNEARLIASFHHPHIVTIYDIGIADDAVFMSMEYVEGGDLKSRLANSIFTPSSALDVLYKIAGALDLAHRNGIVHRDVKPGNILFRLDGTPLLGDFGIAKHMQDDLDLTSTGIFLGSPNYMAPEQAEAGPIDGRADIYALGVILYEMLTGMKPYAADSVVDIIVQHKQAPIPTLPEGLDGYQEMLELMMAKKRKDRFRDCASLMQYIDQLGERGLVKSTADLHQHPDLDVTSSEDEIRIDTLEGTGRGADRRRSPVQVTLLVLLIIASSVFGGVMVAANRFEAAQNRIRSAPEQAVPESLVARPPPALPSPDSGSAGEPSSAEVKRALVWLAEQSLEEFRLTAPPRDNAYYYYSRLARLEPGSEVAREGLLRIAERFAMLAERELANGNTGQASSYIEIGLQIDPGNQALQQLEKLAEHERSGFLSRLFSGRD